MTSFVLDCSVTIGWFLNDEKDSYSLQVLNSMSKSEAIVPVIWRAELINTFLKALKAGRTTENQCILFLSKLGDFTIEIVEDVFTMEELLMIGQKYSLSSYDAIYLDLALRHGYPLATNDTQLAKAMKKAGGKLYLK